MTIMLPATRELFSDVAARYGVTPAVLLERQLGKQLLAARIEIAKALHERGYNLVKIGKVMRRNPSTASFYLGRLGSKQPKVKLWSKPEAKRIERLPLAQPPRLVRYAGWDAHG